MSVEIDASLLSYYKNSYYMKAKEFRRRLVSQLQFMGYTVLIVCQIKFGGSVILFFLRMAVQSLLGTPYPTKAQLETIASNYTALGSQDENTESSVHRTIVSKVQRVFLHMSMTFNIFMIIISIMWPFDFESLLEYYRMPGIPNLENTPSPFNNDHNLIAGEFRGYLFAQYIGERVPVSNLRGNLSYLFWQFCILCCQAGLYLLTVIELSPLREDDEQKLMSYRPCDTSDGYSGNVTAFETDPKAIVECMADNRSIEKELARERANSMV